MKSIVIKLSLFIVLLLGSAALLKIRAQTLPPAEKGFELMELVKIAEVYRQAPALSFNFTYIYADSAQPASNADTLTGTSKVASGNYWSSVGGVEFVQGYQYNITVYYSDSTIVLNNKQDYNSLLSLPLLDSMFRQANVDSMNITEYNDSTRLLSIFFKPNAVYSKFQLKYDKYQYLIRDLQFYSKGLTDFPSGTSLFTLKISNYSAAAIDESVFKEDRFIYKLNGSYYTKPAFSGFKLQINTIN